MTIKAEEFETFRAWSASFIEHAISLPSNLPPQSHPIAVLDAMAHESPARARQGLEMMIGDFVEGTAHLSMEEVDRLDTIFCRQKLPTLSSIRARFMKQIKSIVKRGIIRSEKEYYLIRNAIEGAPEQCEQPQLWAMLAAYEKKAAN